MPLMPTGISGIFYLCQVKKRTNHGSVAHHRLILSGGFLLPKIKTIIMMYFNLSNFKQTICYFFEMDWETVKSQVASLNAKNRANLLGNYSFVWKEELADMVSFLETQFLPKHPKQGEMLLVEELEVSLHPTYVYQPQTFLLKKTDLKIPAETLELEFNLLKTLVENKMTYRLFNPRLPFKYLKYYLLEYIIYEFYSQKVGRTLTQSQKMLPLKRIKTTAKAYEIKAYFNCLSENNADGIPIMSAEDVAMFLEMTFEGMPLPQRMSRFTPNIGVGRLRYLVYEFYRKYGCGRHQVKEYVEMLHRSFVQFDKCGEVSTLKNFSKIPPLIYSKK